MKRTNGVQKYVWYVWGGGGGSGTRDLGRETTRAMKGTRAAVVVVDTIVFVCSDAFRPEQHGCLTDRVGDSWWS